MKTVLSYRLLFTVGALIAAATSVAAGPDVMDQRPDGSEHVHVQRGATRTSSTSPVMTSHGGPVIHASKTMAIFWGSQWTSSSFAGDKINGMDLFFGGFNGSQYASTGDEYYDNSGYVTSQSTYLGHVLDTSAAPARALKTSAAVAEVCKITSNNPDPAAIYFLYTSTGAGQVNYCAWHSWGTCSNGARVQVAYMPNIDGIAGCNPNDTQTGHSEGLSALANVTAHELMEAITDPRGNAWYDASGNENGDKCAWAFPANGALSTFNNGSSWKLQMEWSNAAFNAGTGQPNLSGQNACIY